MKPTNINFENVFTPYKARKLTEADIPDILDLYSGNTEYFMHCPPSPNRETAERYMNRLMTYHLGGWTALFNNNGRLKYEI